ncbi:MAG TPA: hypothetical protein VH852_02355 [Hyphomicrobium sp.]|jgi:hypothetical protein
MRPFLFFMSALSGLAFAMTPAGARLQPDIICVEPDAEFPVACDEDDD